MKFQNKFNDISENDLKLFKNRKVLFNSTVASCLEVENCILTLENLQIFCTKRDYFFNKLNSTKFVNYPILEKYNLFYKFLLSFLSDNKNKDSVIMYVYEKTLLDHLKESAILFVDENINL